MDYKYVGRDDVLFDTGDRAGGAAVYACDIKLPGMLYMKLIVSPVPHGIVKNIDDTAALALPGVAAVLTADNTPGKVYNRARVRASEDVPDQETLFTKHVRCVGDRIGAVLAESPEIAEKAASLVKLEIEELPFVCDVKEALDTDIVIHEKEQIIKPEGVHYGDYEADSGLELVQHTRTQRMHHLAMENHCAVASYKAASGEMEIWTATQSVFGARSVVATILGLPMHKIRVYKTTMGGSFGSKQEMILEPLAACASMHTGRPVKLWLNRSEVMSQTICRHPVEAVLKGKFTKDHRLTAIDLSVILDAGAYQTVTPDYCGSMSKKLSWVYDLESVEYNPVSVCTNTPVTGSYRGWGGPETCFIMETFMNMAARRFKLDPIELRLKSILKPYATSTIGNFSLGNLPLEKTILKGREVFRWEERKAACAAQDRKGRYLKGIGMAISTHTSGYYPRRPDWGTVVMKMEEDGTVSVNVNVHDHGCGSRIAFKKIIGEVLSLDPSRIAVPEGDTLYNAIDNGCYTSRSVYVLGRAVQDAAEELKSLIFDYAAEMLGCEKERLACEDECVYRMPLRTPDGRGVTLEEPIRLSYSDIAYYAADHGQGALFVSHTYIPQSNPGPAMADFAEVEVDTYTGICRLTEYVSCHDIGKAINPEICKSQIGSGVQNGAGMVFCEELKIDPKTGFYTNDSLEKYHVLRAPELPDIKAIFVEDADERGPFGAKSIGEAAFVPVAPAVLEAVNNALGAEFTSLPVTPERVLRFLNGEDYE